MACSKKKPDLYWVMGAGEPHGKGFKSIVEARKAAIRELKANKSYSVRNFGVLDIVLAKDEPYRHKMNYRLVGAISKSDTPNVYVYDEYKPGLYSSKKLATKLVTEKGTVIRGR